VWGTTVKELARQCGFELAGIAPALPAPDADRFLDWVAAGMAGKMAYLTDHRAVIRTDPRHLLAGAKSIICVGKLYQTAAPHTSEIEDASRGWISRYAWGRDYHDVLRQGLQRLAASIREEAGEFEYKICVDTAPLLERSYARLAGLGWIGRNTCLINEGQGSWFFLGELITSLELEPDSPAAERCGTCTRCIDACPTQALVPGGYGWQLDSERCISYLTIELRGDIPAENRSGMGQHIFGCDICQDVCPWNSRAPETDEPAFASAEMAPYLAPLAEITENEFRTKFRDSPVKRTKYSGFLRNVAVAMGNSRNPEFRPFLEKLAVHVDETVSRHAAWALEQIDYATCTVSSDS
jgi:epoxyqueuosine reductase